MGRLRHGLVPVFKFSLGGNLWGNVPKGLPHRTSLQHSAAQTHPTFGLSGLSADPSPFLKCKHWTKRFRFHTWQDHLVGSDVHVDQWFLATASPTTNFDRNNSPCVACSATSHRPSTQLPQLLCAPDKWQYTERNHYIVNENSRLKDKNL